MLQRKVFKYFATRVANIVILRRTVTKLTRVRSMLYKPNSEFRLEQVTYTGGRIIGCLTYPEWAKYSKIGIQPGGCARLTREQVRALDPYIYKQD
jgi:hypothetical protein